MLESETCRRQDNTQALTFVSPRNDIDYIQRLEKHDTRRLLMAPQYRVICGYQLSTLDKDVVVMLPESMDVQNAPAPTSDKIAFANLATCERSGIGRIETEMPDRRDERLSQKRLPSQTRSIS